MTRIVVTDATFPKLDQERAVAAKWGETLEEARCASPADVLRAASGTDILLVQFAQITVEVIEKLAPHAAIIRYGLGLDNIDLQAAQRRGIRVAYVPDYATSEVADHTVSLILAALRRIVALDRSVRAGSWEGVVSENPIASFSETTIGFLGFGRIGREVHARVRPFGFKTVLFDPVIDANSPDALQASSVDLDTLFQASDVLTLHAPLTAQTRHIVNAHRLSQMKASAIVVNTARGALIDTEALERALRSGRLAGAALDVFEKEPLPADAGLRQCSNAILTPHLAWYSNSAIQRLQALVADEMQRYLSGQPARCSALPTAAAIEQV